ncbi:peptidoglycan-binding domain-containing protein [Siccibacter turicensis]|uniref:peptidoglycan-binding domain-containing protein n=1 Tax=Siccibacter turicensis TaxID=357233 RepID=UPI003F5728ED
MKQCSGPYWITTYPGSKSVNTLAPSFRYGVENFLAALEHAGAQIIISATLRPPERAWLMHWSWKLFHRQVSPFDIPVHNNINIEWLHRNRNNEVDIERTREAARQMVYAYGMQNLCVAPALHSRHTEGKAIDMTISWLGNLMLKGSKGNTVCISSLPQDGMNAELHAIGAEYGVIKYHGGSHDKPHWSSDGR